MVGSQRRKSHESTWGTKMKGMAALVLLLVLTALTAQGWAAVESASSLASPESAPFGKDDRFGRSPLFFEANKGQWGEPVRFVSRGEGYNLILTSSAAVLDVPGGVLRMEFAGARASVRVGGEEPLEGKVHYLLGNRPEDWHAGVPVFGKVVYEKLYPGIDAVFYGSPPSMEVLEYDFLVAPGGDPADIRLTFRGVSEIRVDEKGGLVLETQRGEILQSPPVVYQENEEGRREPLAGRYVLYAGNRVGFAVESYDRARTLVIDPVLVYSTYAGGYLEDSGNAVAVDETGAVYVAGSTESPRFDTAYLDILPNAPDAPSYEPRKVSAFVLKMNPSGSDFVYKTYLGGTGDDVPYGIAVDPLGAAYVAGVTDSVDFPAVAAFQSFNGGGEDAFVVKLDPTGSELVYATYLGGVGLDEARDVAVDCTGRAYLTGQTFSPDFPVTRNAFRSYAGAGDAFLTVLGPSGLLNLGLDPSGTYSTFLGGTCCDRGFGVALQGIELAPNFLDVACTPNIFVTGDTNSPDFPVFPTTGAVPPLQDGKRGEYDAFVTQFDAVLMDLNVTNPVYSTYLGGEESDTGRDIAVDRSGSAYVTGETASVDFPVYSSVITPPFQGFNGGDVDGFVSRLSPDGSSLIFSTYLGGAGQDRPQGIDLDLDGDVYVAGDTDSLDFPVYKAVQPLLASECCADAFLTQLDPTGTELVYSTFLGGAENDGALDLAVDASSSAVLTGVTFSSDFPVADPVQAANAGISDAFVAKICMDRPVVGGYLQGRVVAAAVDTRLDELVVKLDRRALDGRGRLYLSFEFPEIPAFRKLMWFRPSNDKLLRLVDADEHFPFGKLVKDAFGFFADAGEYDYFHGELTAAPDDLAFKIGNIAAFSENRVVFRSWYLEDGLPFNADNLVLIQMVDVIFN